MSIARSSTGRARERAHDRAGVARVDEQPQPGEQVAHLGALEERRRAREPVRHGALLERDGDRLALVADRAHEHADVLGRDPASAGGLVTASLVARDEPLDLGGDRLRLRALALAAPEGDLAGWAGWISVQRLGDPVRHRLGDRAGGGEDALGAAVALLEPHDRRGRPLGLEVAQVLRRRAAQPVDRLVVVAGGADLAVLAREQPHQQALGEVRVLQLVDEHVAVARRHPRAHVRLGAQDAEGVQQQVAEVERPRLLEHAVVGGVDGGELALAVGLGPERPGPRRVVLVRDELVLEAVDAADDRAEQGARVAAQVVRGERQLVDALEQHRDAVGRA